MILTKAKRYEDREVQRLIACYNWNIAYYIPNEIEQRTDKAGNKIALLELKKIERIIYQKHKS